MKSLDAYDQIVTIGVDIQNDFCPEGALAVPEGDKIIPVFNKVAEWTRNRRGIVALTADWHPEDTSHFDVWPRHCVADTEGAMFHPDLVVKPEDYILRKGTEPNEDAYSGFDAANDSGITLEELIAPAKEVEAILIGGLATDYCVKATVLDAVEKAKDMRYADVFVIEDAIAGVNIQPDDSTQAIEEMKAAGAVFLQSKDILKEA